jgi:hypothetical protein
VDWHHRMVGRLHGLLQIEYTDSTGQAVISPAGVREVEERLLRAT